MSAQNGIAPGSEAEIFASPTSQTNHSNHPVPKPQSQGNLGGGGNGGKHISITGSGWEDDLNFIGRFKQTQQQLSRVSQKQRQLLLELRRAQARKSLHNQLYAVTGLTIVGLAGLLGAERASNATCDWLEFRSLRLSVTLFIIVASVLLIALPGLRLVCTRIQSELIKTLVIGGVLAVVLCISRFPGPEAVQRGADALGVGGWGAMVGMAMWNRSKKSRVKRCRKKPNKRAMESQPSKVRGKSGDSNRTKELI